MSDRIPIP